MNQALNLSQGGEYALASLSRLALSHPKPLPVETLARVQRIPKPFLSKILGRCAKAGIVRAKTGPTGGMSLAHPPERITMLDIIEACEGPLHRAHCVFYAEKDCTGPDCEIYCPLRKSEESLRKRLGSTSLAAMARSLAEHPLNKVE